MHSRVRSVDRSPSAPGGDLSTVFVFMIKADKSALNRRFIMRVKGICERIDFK